MPAISTIIAGIGLAVAAAGAVTQYIGSQQVATSQARQEQIRQQQMTLEAERQRREAYRKMIVAQAQGTNNAANQGANATDSSVVGGLAQATGIGNQSFKDISQNQTQANALFAENRLEANGRGMMGLGSAVSSFGSGVTQNSGAISRVGQSFGLCGNQKGVA